MEVTKLKLLAANAAAAPLRSLLSPVTALNTKRRSFNSAGGSDNSWRTPKKGLSTSSKIVPPPAQNSKANFYHQQQLRHGKNTLAASLPVFARAAEFRGRVAVFDSDGGFLYEDIYRRSLELAESIEDVIRQTEIGRRPDPTLREGKREQYRVGFLCPNGASYVITQWAVWMGGNVAVPLGEHLSKETLEHCVRDADCDLVVAAKASVDLVHDICKRANKKLICLDNTWTSNPKKEFDTSEPLPATFANGVPEALPTMDSRAMILYARNGTSRQRRLDVRHSHIAAQVDIVSMGWDLDERASFLNVLPLTSVYGIITAMMAPLSVGGKVVMIPNFDSVKVWSYLLGLGGHADKGGRGIPKVNLFPSVPEHYTRLMAAYRQLFAADSQKREYVRAACRKRLRATLSSLEPLPPSLSRDWREATGHPIVDCYTTAVTGTVLSGPIVSQAAANGNGADKQKEEEGNERMLALPGVQTRIVRQANSGQRVINSLSQQQFHPVSSGCVSASLSKPEVLDENARSPSACVGELWVRTPGLVAADTDEDVTPMGWFATGDRARMAKGKFDVLQGSASSSQ